MALLQEVHDSFPADSGVLADYGRHGDVTIEQLVKIVGNHSLRTVKVASNHFGLLDISKRDAVERVQGMAAKAPEFVDRIQERKGETCTVKASIYLSKKRDVKIEAWTLYIHHIRGVVDGADHSWNFYG